MASTGNSKVPKMHKACVYDNPGSCSIAVRQVETPEPGPGEVLVKLTHSGICHSDYGVMMNTVSRPVSMTELPTRYLLTHASVADSGHICHLPHNKARWVATKEWDLWSK